MPSEAEVLESHYGREALEQRILATLARTGKNSVRPCHEDLAPLDQFHIGGAEATYSLAGLSCLSSGQDVLDLGSGIGGPARLLASEFGVNVTGLDVTGCYCRAAQGLTARMGLEQRVTFVQGSALDLPFADASFDRVWVQHMFMNVMDKPCVYAEIHRVLRPRGRLSIFEIVAGPVEGLYLPVPWARRGDHSFLEKPQVLRSQLTAAGFRERIWRDVTAPALEWFQERQAARRTCKSAPPVGLRLLFGEEAPLMAANMLRNLEARQIGVVQGVFDRVGP